MEAMMGISDAELMQVIDEAHEAGVKLEIHQGLPIWEFLPSPIHAIVAERVSQSVRKTTGDESGCGCFHYQDMSIRFPDGSIRRPDISIFCEEPSPTQTATTSIPKAVVEIVSPGSEIKDLELSPPFYLLHGVLDVVVFDPRTGMASHFRREERKQLQSPFELALECGCSVSV
ncbi:Uma2 family endonuclease [Fimbriimonas ginsengisoli]|uniref:Putative restriction endonuclease domain-containing protein n=1 Tax=Fimbriimonas ginsengisoli Gsoil 348 TaxID=661478 RepID=A0A068NMS8_FIMGI|nr:Uma2 family endonuclease [Fimbriimonas ginsengisoli]AIE84873.1 hypothetical protein OP10G_1505 [Fimbriimonas ginsengisoli Gsoil 348]